MLCKKCLKQLQECTAQGILSEQQLESVTNCCKHMEPDALSGDAVSSDTSPVKEREKGFNPIMVFYYFGAFLIISAFGWFLGSHWFTLGDAGILIVCSIYALVFVLAGNHLYKKEKFTTAGGLLITCAVGMTPLIVYSLQRLFNVWPMEKPGLYSDYY
ncbi:MAG: DUF2157 domain-containing protein, partial [Elusimicrobia bacterium]|nr:DUF2157 domain-containing protein [Elusimicrobiota bacterium]MBD3412412.1 DUF2157 domain-containing protein [Elusimicrobiota bacterium]